MEKLCKTEKVTEYQNEMEKRLFEANEISQKAEEALASLTEMIANVSFQELY